MSFELPEVLVSMKCADVSIGPDWGLWVVFAILSVLSAVLLSGHGSWLISGYNTASEGEKAKYDAKKLCRTTGAGMAVITVLILIMGIFEDVLPAGFAYIALGISIIDCIAVILVTNTKCKK